MISKNNKFLPIPLGESNMEYKEEFSNEGKSLPPPCPFLPDNHKTLGIFESHSSPGKYHYVNLKPDGKIYCTCRGFDSHNKCWHYRGMTESLEENPLLLSKLTSPLLFLNPPKTLNPQKS